MEVNGITWDLRVVSSVWDSSFLYAVPRQAPETGVLFGYNPLEYLYLDYFSYETEGDIQVVFDFAHQLLSRIHLMSEYEQDPAAARVTGEINLLSRTGFDLALNEAPRKPPSKE